MKKTSLVPGYVDDLGWFVADLRSSVFSSQSKIARHLGLSHTTISRYENNKLTPPAGYVTYLAQLLIERLTKVEDDITLCQAMLLTEVNKAFRTCYSDDLPFDHWDDLLRMATAYTRSLTHAQQVDASLTGIIDWGSAPDVSVFYDRESELEQLENWVIAERCRLVIVLGIGGIGKTALVTRLAQQLAPQFGRVLWRSLHNAPDFEYTIREICHCLLPSVNIPDVSNNRILRVIETMREQRCLLVLDNLEAIMRSGEDFGEYLAGYEAYGDFIKVLANTPHQGCLLLTSREQPAGFSELITEQGAVRAYHLGALPTPAVQQLLQARNLNGTLDIWHELVQRYSGNPLGLKLISETIEDMYAGDIERFLQTESAGLSEIRRWLDRSFDRLPALAVDIVHWLAINREPLTLDELAARLTPPRADGQLVDALRALQRSSLVENHRGQFSIPNVVSEYATNRLMRQVYREITTDNLATLRKVALITTDTRPGTRRIQTRLLLQPITQRLISEFGFQGAKQKLDDLLDALRMEDRLTARYAAGNLLNLMLKLGLDVTGYDFSNLAVWHANLRNVTLHDVDFSRAELCHCLFDNVFVGVNTIALSPQQDLLAIASSKEIRVWRLHDGQPHRILQGHMNLVWDLAFSADGHHLFSRDDGGALFRWDMNTGHIDQVLTQTAYALTSLALSDSAGLVLAGSKDGTIYIWDATTGQEQSAIPSHIEAAVYALAIDTKGQLLAVGSADGTLALYHITKGRLIARFEGHESAITAMTFVQNGASLVSASVDSIIKLWNVETQVLEGTLSDHDGMVSDLRCCPDGVTLISASYDRTIRLWDLSRPRLSRILGKHDLPVSSIDLDATGTILASGSYDRSVHLWDVRSAHVLNSIRGVALELRTLAFSADAYYLAVGSTDYHIYVWNLESGQRAHVLRGHERWVEAIDYSPVGHILASGGYDRTARLWDLNINAERAILADHSHWVLCVRYGPDGKVLATGSVDRQIRLWDIATAQVIHTLRGHLEAVTCLAFNPQQPTLASGSKDGTVRIWHRNQGELLMTLTGQLDTAIMTLAFSVDGRILIDATKTGHVRWRDASTGTLEHEWCLSDGPAQVITLSRDGCWLACFSGGNTVTLYDARDGRVAHIFPASGGTITALAFDNQGSKLASCSSDGCINVWDVIGRQVLKTLTVHRPYEGMILTAATGLTETQHEVLRALGARNERIAMH